MQAGVAQKCEAATELKSRGGLNGQARPEETG